MKKTFNKIACNASAKVLSNKEFIEKSMTILMVFMFVSFVFATVAIPGFASDPTTQIKEIGKNIYSFILGISTVLAVVAESVAACMYFFSSDGRKVESAGAWMKRIALGWVFINCMGIIVSFFTTYLEKADYQWS